MSGHTVGIDVGTAFTTVAAHHADGHHQVFDPLPDGPSCETLLGVDGGGDLVVGRRAAGIVATGQRLVRDLTDPDPVLVGGHALSGERLLARLITEVSLRAHDRLGTRPELTVLARPGWVEPYHVDLVTTAVRLADIGPVELTSTPLAVAADHLWGAPPIEGRHLVIDVGAGVTEVAAVRVEPHGGLTLVASQGADLGGLDLDRALLERLGTPAIDLTDGCAHERALTSARRAREELGEFDHAVVLTSDGRAHELGRADLDAVTTPLLTTLDELLVGVLGRAGGVDSVLVTGGVGRSAPVRRWLADRCPGIPVEVVDSRAAARGAALIGRSLVARRAPAEVLAFDAVDVGPRRSVSRLLAVGFLGLLALTSAGDSQPDEPVPAPVVCQVAAPT